MKFLPTGVITLFVLLILQPGAVRAQTEAAAQPPSGQAAGQEIEQLAEIVVSASQVPLEAKAVGSSVTVITADEIERKQARVVSDLLREVPGISVHRSGTVGAITSVRIRGNESGHTLVLVDGVKVNDPSGLLGSFDFGPLLTSDIERIEVLRGPQSGLYGSDAIGGVVNIITRRGRGPAAAHASVEGGSFGTVNAAAGIRGSGDRYHFSAGATNFRSSGISLVAGPEKDGYRNQTYNAKTGLELADDLELELFARYVKARVETDNPAETPPDTRDKTDSAHTTGRARLKYSLFDGGWKHALGVAGHRTERTFLDARTFSGDATLDEYDGERMRLDYETNVFFETSGTVDATHNVTLATEREKDSVKHGQRPRDSREHTYRARSSVTNYSHSAEYQLGILDQLFLSGSVRYDDNEHFKDSTTLRLAAAWLLEESGTRFHGSYGTGVKNPTLSQLYGRWGPNPDLKPEKSKGWDLGVEQKLLERRLSLDVTYFNNRPTNLIQWHDQGTADFADDGYANVEGTSRIRGVELTLRAKPVEGMSLSAQYTYTRAKDADGRPLRRRARRIASANLGYDFLDGRAGVDLGVDYNGDQVDQYNQPRIPSYTLVNLAGKYGVTRDIELFGRIENLFNKDYYELRSFNMRKYRTTGIGFFAGIRGTFELPR